MRSTLKLPFIGLFIAILCLSVGAGSAPAQARAEVDEEGLGPVITAYLGYLRNEQEVVDDRASRKEISRAYYRRNSNRIRALREMAIQIAHESQNDYLPELEAVAADEFGTLFEHRPSLANLKVGEVLNFKFRYLGSVRFGDNFYLFARLDPYEQAELRQKAAADTPQPPPVKPVNSAQRKTRPRRVHDDK